MPSGAKSPFHTAATILSSSTRLRATGNEDTDDEIERLKVMAAKLRAEAAELEAEKAQAMADAAEKAFQKFDTNQDGEISLAELKEGLEKTLKVRGVFCFIVQTPLIDVSWWATSTADASIATTSFRHSGTFTRDS